MSAQQLAEEIENLIISASDDFENEVVRLQGVIYSKLLSVLKNLEIDQDGYIKQNTFNRKLLSDVEGIIDDILPGNDFTKTVSESLLVIPKLDDSINEYFLGISDKYNPNRNFIKSLQAQTIKTIEESLLQDGLSAAVKMPLKEIMNLNINTGGNFSGFLQQVRNFIEGNDDLDGRLLSYSRGILRDTLFNYSRAFQQSITTDLKLEFYRYTGGIIDKTREFCLERVGEYFHETEIKKWANLEWKGKRQGTTTSSIFIYCGGYNCTHSLVPVDISIVPKNVISRIQKP